MVSKLQTDDSVTPETLVMGHDGLLEKLESYFVDDYPLINHRHDFTTCKHAQCEIFTQWCKTKLRKAKECNLKKMTSDNWLELELIRGVSDMMLQK